MPYTNPKHKVRHQRQRRRAGLVRRIEVTLSADATRDHEIADYLDSLPHGVGAEFIRQAIIEKIDRETELELEVPPVPEQQPTSSASAEFNALFAELDHQRREAGQQMNDLITTIARQSDEIAALREQLARQPEPAAGVMTEPVEVASSGLEMERPRPGSARSALPPNWPEPPEIERSEGIDMSRARPRPAARRAPVSVPAVEADTVTDADLIALGKLMSRSIKNAEPGRSRTRD